MKGSTNIASRKYLFRKLEFLTIPSQYIFSLMMFVVNNNTFKSSINEIHKSKKYKYVNQELTLYPTEGVCTMQI